jgi:hypothetical protein
MSDGSSTIPAIGPPGFVNGKRTQLQWEKEFPYYFIEGDMVKEDIPWKVRNHIYVMMLRGKYLEFEDVDFDYEDGMQLRASRYSLKKNLTKEDIKKWVDELKTSEEARRDKELAKQMQSLKLKQ